MEEPGGMKLRIFSSNNWRETMSCPRTTSHAKQAAKKEAYSSLLMGPMSRKPMEALLSTSRWHSR